jgi:hypothetical protein
MWNDILLTLVSMDPEAIGVELVHILMACDEAIQRENIMLANMLVRRIALLTSLQTRVMSNVASYFAEAFARRINIFDPD